MLYLAASLQTLGLNLKNRLTREETGATAVEYGIMVALIAVVIIATVSLIGDQLLEGFNTVLTELGGTPPA